MRALWIVLRIVGLLVLSVAIVLAMAILVDRCESTDGSQSVSTWVWK